MMYSDLGKLDSTPDQDLGLTIAFKTAANAGQTEATTPEEYLVERVMELLVNYDQRWVTGEKQTRIAQAVSTALVSKDGKLEAAAVALGVDLAVVVPDDVIKADPGVIVDPAQPVDVIK